ncbi:RING finger protein 122 isoform X3 [Bubalus kerabau]|uniref:RING finger protein 122 isoform X3 n=1 Tax=Bubalus bubalis TaxID=89462 RepID=UPI001E1B7307|nr:RING finger protein 122 isoform X3 [Bubalus bubalis]XP_055423096.1 RING finger protein 122 isoform X3 [Bubalus carabanensis]
MHPFQWCNGCFCGLGLVSTNKSCSMPPISFQDLPLNIYMVIFGTGIFVFMLSLIFCCYFISKLRNQAQSERYGYKEVVLKGDAKKLQLYGVSGLGQQAGCPAADLCRLSGRLQGQGRARCPPVPTRLSPQVSGEVAGGALCLPHV